MTEVEMHIGRGWIGHEIEDGCPCPKGPCGLAVDGIPDCPEHGLGAAKTIRQFHVASTCPSAQTPVQRCVTCGLGEDPHLPGGSRFGCHFEPEESKPVSRPRPVLVDPDSDLDIELLASAFRAEWEQANREGDTGNRTSRGLRVALQSFRGARS